MITLPIPNAALGYIPVNQIMSDNSYRFHRPNTAAIEALKASLLRSGQTHPMLLESLPDGSHRVIDGHRRLEAVHALVSSGHTWDKIWANTIPTPKNEDILRWMLQRHSQDGIYGLTEKGHLLAWAQASGLGMTQIAHASGLSYIEVEDFIELSATPSDLADILDQYHIDSLLAAMLVRRFLAWRSTRHGPRALITAKQILEHSKMEPISVRGWRFLLEFYWSGERPFMGNSPSRTIHP